MQASGSAPSSPKRRGTGFPAVLFSIFFGRGIGLHAALFFFHPPSPLCPPHTFFSLSRSQCASNFCRIAEVLNMVIVCGFYSHGVRMRVRVCVCACVRVCVCACVRVRVRQVHSGVGGWRRRRHDQVGRRDRPAGLSLEVRWPRVLAPLFSSLL